MNLQDQIEEKLRLNSSTGRAKFDSKLVKTRYPIQGVKMAFLIDFLHFADYNFYNNFEGRKL